MTVEAYWRKWVIERSGNVCEVCRERPLAYFHRLTDQLEDDSNVLAVCVDCDDWINSRTWPPPQESTGLVWQPCWFCLELIPPYVTDDAAGRPRDEVMCPFCLTLQADEGRWGPP